jgi:hypothetical protein
MQSERWLGGGWGLKVEGEEINDGYQNDEDAECIRETKSSYESGIMLFPFTTSVQAASTRRRLPSSPSSTLLGFLQRCHSSTLAF